MKLSYLKNRGKFVFPLLLLLVSSVSLKADDLAPTAPTPVGSYTPVYLNAAGVGEYIFSPPIFYNPLTDSIGYSQKFFSCTDLNDTVRVYITITNIALSVPVAYHWDTTDVIVVDTIAPNLNMSANFALSLNVWGYDTLSFSDIDQGSNDNCSIDFSTLVFSRDTVFDCTDVGNHFVWVSAADASGNIDSTMVTVSVNDALPPTLVLQDDTLYFDNTTAQDTIRFSDLDNGSYDNCGLDSATLNTQSYLVFSCADLGQNMVNVLLWDIIGNSSAVSANVWVLDTVSPVYIKSDTVLYLNSASQALSRNDFVSPATGGCYPPALTIYSDTVFTCSDIVTSPNYIVFQYTNGPLDSVSVSVLDTMPPTLALANDTIYLDGIVTADSVQFSDLDNGSFDNCGLDSALLNGSTYASFTCADTGVNQISVQLWDLDGNLATGMATVYVIDTVQPQYTKNNLTVYLILSTDTLTRSDFLSTANGGCYPPQLTIFSDTVMDCGNAVTNPNYIRFQLDGGPMDSIMVNVYDTLAPALILQTHNLYLNNAYDTLMFADVNNGSIDNCSLDTATLNGSSQLVFSCSDLGTQKVVVRLWDPNGNMSIDSVNVTVLDTTTPNYVKTPHTVYLISDSVVVSRNDILSNVSGGCFPPVITLLSDTVLRCNNAQTNPNYILFSLNGGPADSVPVTVIDTLVPNLLVANDTLYLNSPNAQDSVMFSNFDVGSNDNCGISNTSINNTQVLYYSCVDTGVHQIIVHAWDASLNQSIDTVDLYVLDTSSFNYSKFDQTIYIGYQADTLSRNDFVSTATAGCIVPVLNVLSDTSFDCSDIAANPNYIVFQFTNGPKDSVMATVLDTLKPILNMQSDTLYVNNALGSDSTSFTDLNAGSFDNCGLDSGLVNGLVYQTYSCADTGANHLVVQLWDVNGNVQSDSVTVYVLDTVAPVYVKTPHTAYLISDSVVVLRDDILSNATGGCFAPKLTFLNDTIFYCSSVNTNPSYILFQFAGGSVDSVPVTILDTIAPSLSLMNDTVYLGASGAMDSIAFVNIDAGSIDNCSIDSTTINGQQQMFFDCLDTGAHLILLQAWDPSGNTSLDSSTVYVLDTVQPQYTKSNLVVNLILSTDTLRRTDFLSSVNGGCFPPQLTIFSDTVMDCGNALTNPNFIRFQFDGGPMDSVQIDVFDNVAPVLLLKSHSLYVNAGNDTLKFTDVNNGSVDNCSLDSATLNGSTQLVFSCSDLGTQKIVVRLWDPSGNMSIDSLNVLVLDTVTPSYTKTPYTAYLNSDSIVVSRNDILSNISGGCFPPTVSILSDTVMSCRNTQSNPNYILFSLNGGTADSVPVTVLDTLVPNLNLRNDTLYLSAIGAMDSIVFANLDAGSSDNCGIENTVINGQQQLYFDCLDTGAQTITVQAWDESGNTSIDSSVVYVLDTAQLTYTVNAVTAYLNLDSAVVTTIDIVSNLKAGCFTPEVLMLSDTVFYCSDIALNPSYIKFTVNEILDSAAVTVIDTISPDLILHTHTVYLGSNDTLRFSDIDNNSFDNCGLDSVQLNGFDYLVYDCTDLGTQQVSVVLYDENGNLDFGTVSIQVTDTVTPVYTAVPFTSHLVGSFTSVSREDLFLNISTSCAPPNVSFLSDTTFDCSDIPNNPNYVLFTLDGMLDSVAITVSDTTAPTLNPKTFVNLVLSANGTRTLSLFDVLNGFPQDNCSVASGITINPQVLNCSNTNGFTPVVITASDIYGNIDSVTVNVLAQDITPPSLSPGNTVYHLDSLGQLYIDANELVIAKDSCGIDTVYTNVNTFSCADTGTTTLFVTATDVNNNTVFTNVQFSISDTTAPSFSVVTADTLFLNAQGNATLKFSDILLNGPYDGCGIKDTSISQTSYSCADVQPKLVNVSVTDHSGNSNTQQIQVVAMDTLGPVLFANNITIQIDSSTGKAGIDFFDVIGFAADNCELDSTSFQVTPNTFDCDSLGLRTVRAEAVDIYGNYSKVFATVEVKSYNAKNFILEGPDLVCENAYNVKYTVKDFNESADYTWTINGGTLISSAFKGREAFVHWNTPGTGSVIVNELGGCSIGKDSIFVTKSGVAPDTAFIAFWNPISKSTLVCTDQNAISYQWGYDIDSSGSLYSISLIGETKNSYYNFFLNENISDLGYRYWCETSYDGVCFTRNYLFGAFPVKIDEFEIGKIDVWPVPFEGEVNVSAAYEMASISLIDMFGKEIKRIPVNGLMQLRVENLENLPPGTYVLRVTYENGSKSNHKIVHLR